VALQGGSALAMAGKDCVALAVDLRAGTRSVERGGGASLPLA
jgi:20S proteasome alpha/beta subunit